MLGRPASEKRQGAKSREVGAPSVPRALWGFSRGVRLGEAGRSTRQFLCLAGWVWLTGRISAAGVAGQCWRCHCGPIYRPAVSGGYAGRAGQNGERHWGGGSVVRHYEVLIL